MMKKFLVQNMADFEWIESYLQDMSEKGYILTKPGFYLMEFEECEPCRRRYRVISSELKEKHTLPDGWEYIGHAGKLHYYETTDESLPELIEDVREYTKMIKTSLMAGILLLLIGIMQCIGIGDLIHPSYMGTLHILHNEGIPFHITEAVFGIISIMTCIAFFVHWISMRTAIKNEKIDHHRGRRKGWLMNILIVLVILTAILSFANGMEDYEANQLTYDEIKNCDLSHPFTMNELDKAKTDEIAASIRRSDSSIGNSCGYAAYEGRDSLFTKFCLNSVFSTNEKNESEDMFFYANYYEGRNQKIIDQYLEEDIYWQPWEHMTKEKVKLKGFNETDFAGYYRDSYDVQYVWVQRGNRLETVSYDGEKNLLDYMNAIIEDLSEE